MSPDLQERLDRFDEKVAEFDRLQREWKSLHSRIGLFLHAVNNAVYGGAIGVFVAAIVSH